MHYHAAARSDCCRSVLAALNVFTETPHLRRPPTDKRVSEQWIVSPLPFGIGPSVAHVGEPRLAALTHGSHRVQVHH